MITSFFKTEDIPKMYCFINVYWTDFLKKYGTTFPLFYERFLETTTSIVVFNHRFLLLSRLFPIAEAI